MVACAAVHAVGAVRHWSPALSLLTIGVALACLHCVHHLWIAPRVADWVWVTLGSVAMLVLHLVMLAQPAGAEHHHGPAQLGTGLPVDPLTLLGLILPAMGLALAWWALGRAGGRVDLGGAGSLGVGVPVDDHRSDRGHDG